MDARCVGLQHKKAMMVGEVGALVDAQEGADDLLGCAGHGEVIRRHQAEAFAHPGDNARAVADLQHEMAKPDRRRDAAPGADRLVAARLGVA